MANQGETRRMRNLAVQARGSGVNAEWRDLIHTRLFHGDIASEPRQQIEFAFMATEQNKNFRCGCQFMCV